MVRAELTTTRIAGTDMLLLLPPFVAQAIMVLRICRGPLRFFIQV